MTYDTTNIFAKILRGEIPCKKIRESQHSLAFHDIAPQAKIHALVIPKGAYVSWADFSARASDDEIADFVRTIGQIAKELGVEESGYRLLANHGPDSHQEIPHLHVHIFGAQKLGKMLAVARET
jgi:histidine triad (HIT) family protein